MKWVITIFALILVIELCYIHIQLNKIEDMLDSIQKDVDSMQDDLDSINKISGSVPMSETRCELKLHTLKGVVAYPLGEITKKNGVVSYWIYPNDADIFAIEFREGVK